MVKLLLLTTAISAAALPLLAASELLLLGGRTVPADSYNHLPTLFDGTQSSQVMSWEPSNEGGGVSGPDRELIAEPNVMVVVVVEADNNNIEKEEEEGAAMVVEVSHRHVEGFNGEAVANWTVVIGGKTYELNPQWISAITEGVEEEEEKHNKTEEEEAVKEEKKEESKEHKKTNGDDLWAKTAYIEGVVVSDNNYHNAKTSPEEQEEEEEEGLVSAKKGSAWAVVPTPRPLVTGEAAGRDLHSLFSDQPMLLALFKSAVLSLMEKKETIIPEGLPKQHPATTNVAKQSEEEEVVAFVANKKEESKKKQTGFSPLGVNALHAMESFAEVAVRIHNEYRSGLRGVGEEGLLAAPLMLSLPEVQWDSNLADFIDGWLSELARASCNMQHSSNEMRSGIPGWIGVPIGENLFQLSTTRPIEHPNLEAALASWYEEISCYRYGPFQHPNREPGCQQCEGAGGSTSSSAAAAPAADKKESCQQCKLPSTPAGHFTQMMWEGTRHIGCAYKLCQPLAGFQSMLIGCEYGKAGNMVGQIPFNENVAKKLQLESQPDSCPPVGGGI
eukprot:GHVS01105621.1.p1 GENE.GHVS01105621.1~~GHVS01105621.1.p1  ORF type:complete len:558 (+),score=167.22 GHVS01105621.1:478-2151(+)